MLINTTGHSRQQSMTCETFGLREPSILSLRAKVLSLAGSGVLGLEGVMTTEQNSLHSEDWAG